ncbi:PREDICTED: uncharacterized protein LOC106101534 [Papilio polytes]|uniref:uncharacterized protein LOC106101534 n=1 Tax=Papilio polytes TaxID=76194 RepID=UPI0006769682|nr:PREDICTED: uncharacterized protein LOC106101534 [Papilio polytes]
MEGTFKAMTLFDCNHVDEVESIHQFDPAWRQNALSCRVILILQQLYNFKFGFILRREKTVIMRPYYSLPFAKTVWLCILGIIVLVTVIFYVVRRWEKSIVGRLECNFIYEFYIAVGVFCQHSLPSPSIFWSQRMAYFFFVIFAYITNSFYTSNLLSFIVTEKEGQMDIEALTKSHYELKILENMKLATERRVNSINIEMNDMAKKLSRTKSINLSSGLEAVRRGKTALLCDYPTVYSAIARTFDDEAICELDEVDIFSNVKMYLTVGKQFKYTEKLKIGILRMKEAGIIKRLISVDPLTPLTCVRNRIFVSSYSEHIVTPLLVIFLLYVIACILMIAEIVHYNTHKTWPYIN